MIIEGPVMWVQGQMANGVDPMDLLTHLLGAQWRPVSESYDIIIVNERTFLAQNSLTIRIMGNGTGTVDTPTPSFPTPQCDSTE